MVPRDAAWDATWDPEAFSVDGHPVTLRVLGSISNLTFAATTVAACATVSVDLDLMRVVDHAGMVKLLKKGYPVPGTPPFRGASRAF